jgi:hypothetical protein
LTRPVRADTPGQDPRSGRPWAPPSLKAVRERRLSYVVIDDMESGMIGLSVSPWPSIDDAGRLRFGRGRSRSVGSARHDLERFLAKNRVPRSGSRRPLRIGDVFAMAVKEPIPVGQLADPADWIEVPVYDITADARDAAKASFYAAVAPTLDPKAGVDAQILALASERKRTQAPRRGKG